MHARSGASRAVARAAVGDARVSNSGLRHPDGKTRKRLIFVRTSRKAKQGLRSGAIAGENALPLQAPPIFGTGLWNQIRGVSRANKSKSAK